MIASDPNVENADAAFVFANVEVVRVFIAELVEQRVLDGLSDHDADTVGLLVTSDVLRGPAHTAWRIQDWLNPDGNSVGRRDDDTWAVCAVLAEVLTVYLAAFAGPEFEEQRADERWPNREKGTASNVPLGRI
jgi:hypothetical protein